MQTLKRIKTEPLTCGVIFYKIVNNKIYLLLIKKNNKYHAMKIEHILESDKILDKKIFNIADINYTLSLVDDTYTTKKAKLDSDYFLISLEELNVDEDIENFETNMSELAESYRSAKGGKKRSLLYDMNFLASMAIISGYEKPIFIDGKQVTGLVYQHGEKSRKMQFYLEDIFVEDLNEFAMHYDEFVQTGHSAYFFRSNLTNISIMLRCLYTRCFDSSCYLTMPIRKYWKAHIRYL